MRPIRAVRLATIILGVATLLGSPAESATNAPYVGAYEADTFFPTISSNEMAVLRTKKILFLSRSFGLNMCQGLTDLKNQNSMYDILSSYVNYDVMNQGVGTVETNAFSKYNFVHCMATYWPHTTRLTELSTLLRDPPYSFGNQVDVVMVYWHYALSSVFDTYTNTFDKLQVDFPNIKFVYVTAGFMDTNHVSENTESAAFSAKVRTKYQGNAPLYDLGHILNNDSDLLGYCPEYSTDPAGVHPNAAFAEQRMGKAFLLMLRDLYFGSGCTNMAPPTVPPNLLGAALSDSSIKLTWDPADHECGISRYDLMRNGTQITSTTKTNYTDTGLTENTAYRYTIRAVSMADVVSANSPTTTVSTLVDSTPPTVTLVKAVSGTEVSVEFSENMDPVSCGIATNYALNNGVSVLSAVLSGKTVTLTTSAMTDGTLYTLTLNRVADGSSAKNPVIPGSQATFTYVRVLYPSDPTAYWTLDGTLNDSSGNALNGTWVSGSASYGAGLLGQGLILNGLTSALPVTNYMKVNHNSLLDGMPTLSVSIWAKKNDTLAGGDLFRKHTVYSLAINTNSLKGYVTTTVGAANFTVTISGVNDTNWHHYCLVYNGTNVLAYVDSTQRNSMAKSGSVTTLSSSYISIGKNDRNAPYFSFAGNLDEMKIFRRALSTNEISALVSAGVNGSADRAAVRTLLDANGLTNKQVDAISVYDKDRITKLYLQESGISNITANIGQLSELSLLHVYGDRALPYPLLTQVSSGIGGCLKLTELLLSQNSLTNLPTAITNLTKLTICSIGDNLLCGSYPWENWANTYDSDWRASQDCPSSLFYIYSLLNGPGSVFPSTNLAVGAGQSTQIVYSANTWHAITNFIGNGTSVPSAIGATTYTAVYANVSADISNQVSFAVIKAPVDGQTPATWYGPLGANPSAADEDQDALTLDQEYLINSHPAQSNVFQIISAGMDTTQKVSLSWRSLGLPNGAVEIGFRTNLNQTGWIYPAGTLLYTNGVCTWRSSAPATNNTGFMKLKITGNP